MDSSRDSEEDTEPMMPLHKPFRRAAWKVAIVLFAVSGTLALAQSTAPTGRDAEGDRIAAVMEQVSSSVLSVKFEQVIPPNRLFGMGGNIPRDTTGVAITGRVVMVAEEEIKDESDMGDLGRMLGGGMPQPAQSGGPKNFKVVNFDGEVYPAHLTGRDTASGLAFLTIETEEEVLQSVGFDRDATLELAEQVLLVGTSRRQHTEVRRFLVSRVNGVLAGDVYGLMGSGAEFLGSLVVRMSGKPVGVVTGDPTAIKSAGAGQIGGILQGIMSSGTIREAPVIQAAHRFQKLLDAPPQNVKEKPQPKPSPGGDIPGGGEPEDDEEF